MMLKLLEQLREVDATSADGKLSRHTGRVLRTVEVRFNCSDVHSEQVTDELNEARATDQALESEDGTRWVVRQHSRFNDNGGDWRFVASLDETEVLRATSLEFLGLRLLPTHYDETEAASDGVLVIVAEVNPTAADDRTLERHITDRKTHAQSNTTDYFDLTRVGVRDEPLLVRFGRCLWQRGADGSRRHLLVFVAAEGDDEHSRRGFVGFDEPRSSNTAKITLQSRAIAEAIVEELAAANLLTPAARDRISARGEAAWDRHMRDLQETDDLSLFY